MGYYCISWLLFTTWICIGDIYPFDCFWEYDVTQSKNIDHSYMKCVICKITNSLYIYWQIFQLRLKGTTEKYVFSIFNQHGLINSVINDCIQMVVFWTIQCKSSIWLQTLLPQLRRFLFEVQIIVISVFQYLGLIN